MKDPFVKKQFAVETGKLHIPCPYSEMTDVKVHVVIKDGYCYRSEECMIIWCKLNRIQTDIDSLISLIW